LICGLSALAKGRIAAVPVPNRTMALEVGTRLGHYNVTALIGEGGMGQLGILSFQTTGYS